MFHCHPSRYHLAIATAQVNAGAAPASVPSAKPRVVNQQLPQLEAELKPLAEAGKLDGYGSYAYAMVLRELQRPEEATAALAQALTLTLTLTLTQTLTLTLNLTLVSLTLIALALALTLPLTLTLT